MNRQEFVKKLKDNTWFDNPEELAKHRLPVIQYYLDSIIDLNINGISLRGLRVIYEEKDFALLNQAFESLRKKYGYDK